MTRIKTIASFLIFKKAGRLVGVIFLILFLNQAKAQNGLCPPNLDFEFGDFANWTCATGTVDLVAGVNVITWTGTGPVTNQHTILSAATAGNDPYGNFPKVCPNGSGYSMMLGNNQGGRGAEKITYTYSIPSTATNFSILFNYAVVLQDPDHTPQEQPRFQVELKDLTTNTTIPCASFDFVAAGGLPGFMSIYGDSTIRYKDWTPVIVNLDAYIGKTIQLEFITSDCTRGQHFGYAYIDVNSNCNSSIAGTTICQGDDSITLVAPHGFQSYQWYSDNTFTTLLDTTQLLPLHPAPAVGTVFPVIVFPYPGYGCIDTMYASIAVAPKPVSVAGPDLSICKNQSLQVGGPPGTGMMYAS